MQRRRRDATTFTPLYERAILYYNPGADFDEEDSGGCVGLVTGSAARETEIAGRLVMG